MKKLKYTANPEEPQDQKGRRDFLTKAILGTGALAVTPLSTATGKEHANDVVGPHATPHNYNANAPITAGDLVDNWIEPGEYDATNPLNDPLCLNVMYHTNPSEVTGRTANGTQTPEVDLALFTYNGNIPGPTIRSRGETTIRVNVTNSLPGNNGRYAYLQKTRWIDTNCYVEEDIPDWKIGDRRVYGPHQQHTTNLHTHGLHVRPGRNPYNDTNSDDVILRIIPLEDYCHRIPENLRDKELKPVCDRTGIKNKDTFLPLHANEVVFKAKYQFELGAIGEKHYPGTFWYHPHPHGATYDQVASGMAGFLIVEGDVDDYLNKTIINKANVTKTIETTTTDASGKKNTTTKTEHLVTNQGLKERLIMVQRIVGPPPPADQEGNSIPVNKGEEVKFHFPTVNGLQAGWAVMTMAPNAIERWRVLNASVDGQGYYEYMVTNKAALDKDLNSDTVVVDGQSVKNLIKSGGFLSGDVSSELTYTSLQLWPQKNKVKKTKANANGIDYKTYFQAVQLFWKLLAKHSLKTNLHNLAFDGITLVDEQTGEYTTRLVSSLEMAPANRADFLFQAPEEEGVYTVWARWTDDATDRPALGTGTYPFVIVSTIAVKPVVSVSKVQRFGSNVSETITTTIEKVIDTGVKKKGDELDLQFSQNGVKVPDIIKPVPVEETYDPEAKGYRKRQVIYGGWGDGSIPLKPEPASYRWNTMTISSLTEVEDKNGNKVLQQVGKKYGADNPMGHGFPPGEQRMELNTTEEWTLDNYSMTIYYDNNSNPVYGKNFPRDGSVVPDSNLTITKAADHPFHIHQNPFWVLSIKDATGKQLLPTYQSGSKKGQPIPRWQDVVRIPRNGGRVVFRSRFADYHGKFVNHCHLLQHEDWGMMQVIEVTKKKPKVHGPEIKAPCFQYPCVSLRDIFIHNFDEKYLNPDPNTPFPSGGPDEAGDCPPDLHPITKADGSWNYDNPDISDKVVQNPPSDRVSNPCITQTDPSILFPGKC